MQFCKDLYQPQTVTTHRKAIAYKESKWVIQPKPKAPTRESRLDVASPHRLLPSTNGLLPSINGPPSLPPSLDKWRMASSLEECPPPPPSTNGEWPPLTNGTLDKRRMGERPPLSMN
ncbi:uncharacterized protein LACBIDRAFT_321340 [Laccaria bicolor S238N-H82]|uniref:Predicted protein n=1 Tax=Laccaria bicolor (strain S238N-H82 / ATCC MYA-4686) TaxID=486041 RepID=B0CPN3_LACBS|nr:uncharacterized protein LACBIDRAFT_321340 [Laccaria bicolor S238N-H82]EDR15482.1 predicted protein [Laccaria bicolor S238N-H82]|eukprot:XP_001873690.1 predicted protein [Laccaria bicolor S238N-H82]